jgi:hypothetical protein
VSTHDLAIIAVVVGVIALILVLLLYRGRR